MLQRKRLLYLDVLEKLLTSRLVLVAVYFIFCMYINCVSQVYVQHRAWEYFNHDLQNATVLPDIGFDIFPHITQNAIGSMNWADFITYAIMASTLIRFIFGITREGHRLRGHILRRHIFALGTLFLLRAFAILSTLLPNPLDGCEETLVSRRRHSERIHGLRVGEFWVDRL